jgi:hypothetical protein
VSQSGQQGEPAGRVRRIPGNVTGTALRQLGIAALRPGGVVAGGDADLSTSECDGLTVATLRGEPQLFTLGLS